MSLLLDLDVVFVDCQTTGANPQQGNLLELAWRAGSAREPARASTSAFLARQPEGEGVPRRIQMITGIVDADLAAARGPDELRAAIAAEFARAPVAVAHFAQFERPFMDHLFGGAFPARWICTHKIAKKLLPNLPVKGVRGIAGYFGHRIREEMKRASCHVDATARIWAGLAAALAEQEGIETLEALDEWLAARPSDKKKAKGAAPAYEYPMDRAKRLAFPDRPGVYRMLAKDGDVLYVGKATSLKSRVNSYFRGRKGRDARKLEMLTQTWDIQTTVCGSSLEAALLENDEIKRRDPPYNVSLKARARTLAFFSRDFRSVASEPDAAHPIGPFSSERELEQLFMLAGSLASGEFHSLIFWEPVDPALLAEGFALYCASIGRNAEALASPRALLAQGLREWRVHARDWRLEMAALAGPGEAPEEELDEEAVDQSDEAEDAVAELTAPEIAEKFRRLLRRAGRAYGMARAVSAMLEAQVRFCDRGNERELAFARGRFAGEAAPLAMRAHAWDGLGVADYDRMKVLLSELLRVSSTGAPVAIEPRLRWPLLPTR